MFRFNKAALGTGPLKNETHCFAPLRGRASKAYLDINSQNFSYENPNSER